MSQNSKAHDAVGVKAAEEQELPSLSCRPRWGSLRRCCEVGRAGRAAGAAVLSAGVAACPKVLLALMLVWKGPAVSNHLFHKFELGSAGRISGIFSVKSYTPPPAQSHYVLVWSHWVWGSRMGRRGQILWYLVSYVVFCWCF